MNEVKIITREDCSYCDNAKALLRSKNIEYEELHLGLDITREDVLEKYPTQKLLPVVLIEDELIGGYIELLDWLNPPLETGDNDGE